MDKYTASAQALLDALITDKRTDGTEFVRLADGSPQWMTDAVHAAHGDMLPDDTRYSMIRECLSEMIQMDPEEWDYSSNQIADTLIPVYNAERIKWLASHLNRAAYCDEAQEQSFVSEKSSLMDRIAAGMYVEYIEIADSLISSVNDRAEESDGETEE